MLLDETAVMCSSVKGVSKARFAFGELESRLPSLRGRKCFGHYNPDIDEYRACVGIVEGDPKPEAIGFREWRIPGGRCVYEKICDWNRNIKLIGPTFERMIQENIRIIDWSRPMLEFYKSLNELRLLVPVTS